MSQNYRAHRNGRPTKSKQLQIQKDLRKYFELGISASATASKTGINIKTVCTYFDEFAEEIRESESKEFLERQKKERSQLVVTWDALILSVHEQLDDVQDEINKYKEENKPIPKNLLSLRLEISKYLASLIEKKGYFMMQPIMDEGLRNKIRSMGNQDAKT